MYQVLLVGTLQRVQQQEKNTDLVTAFNSNKAGLFEGSFFRRESI